jgi:glycosyltransferase involved in cell wall biosynthesis
MPCSARIDANISVKILHVVATYFPAVRYGGPIRSVHGLCAALVALGHEVHVYTTNVDGPGESDVPLYEPVVINGVMVWYFPCRRLRRLFWSPQMKSALSQEVPNFDLVHVHSIFLWPTWAAARIADRSGIPYVVSPRGMLVRDLIGRKSTLLKYAWIRFVERRTIESANAVHVTTRKELYELRHFRLSLPPVLIIPNGVDEPENESSGDSAESTDDRAFALFLGRINWKKGLDRLIRAWAFVPEMRLIIAGNDETSYQRELECLADEVGVSERVRFVGMVEGSTKWRLFRQAEIFILPSYSENFGIAVLEAMLMACPVVVTPEVGLAEAVAESRAGIVTAGNPDTLGAAILELLNDKEKRLEMGAIGQRLARDNYCWPNLARQMVAGYERIVAEYA